jgi:hypothetical protein
MIYPAREQIANNWFYQVTNPLLKKLDLSSDDENSTFLFLNAITAI